MFHIQEDRQLYNNKDMTSLHSPPLELLILLYQRFFGMRRVALRSLLKSLDSTVIPVTCYLADIALVSLLLTLGCGYQVQVRQVQMVLGYQICSTMGDDDYDS